ncbi:BamA/TamA family outer membrane protein [Planctomycetes bacterium SV_7m_r]
MVLETDSADPQTLPARPANRDAMLRGCGRSLMALFCLTLFCLVPGTVSGQGVNAPAGFVPTGTTPSYSQRPQTGTSTPVVTANYQRSNAAGTTNGQVVTADGRSGSQVPFPTTRLVSGQQPAGAATSVPTTTGVPAPTTTFPIAPSQLGLANPLANTATAYSPLVTNPMMPPPRVRVADLMVTGFPARTGRVMVGAAVNSDAGVTGQLTIDERNFDITRFPTSWSDFANGRAFRGAGQTFRLEAAPGSQIDSYRFEFADPNLLNYLPISYSVSAFLYDRNFTDWDENRLGARFGLGYRITPNLSLNGYLGANRVKIGDLRLPGLDPELDNMVGKNNSYDVGLSLRHDTRDSLIQASRGHYFEVNFRETFGDFNYSRLEADYRKFWLLRERIDGSGKHTVSFRTQLGFSGDETPIYDNFFAGGYATLRGFDFRGASPVIGGNDGIEVGGQFQFLNSVEYMFPLTADDMFRGVVFCDFGTVEDKVEFNSESFRVAPGFGLRVNIPMMGPAPLAFDFGFPVNKADFDDERVFAFYMSMIR